MAGYSAWTPAMAYPGWGLIGAYPETGIQMGSVVIIACSYCQRIRQGEVSELYIFGTICIVVAQVRPSLSSDMLLHAHGKLI